MLIVNMPVVLIVSTGRWVWCACLQVGTCRGVLRDRAQQCYGVQDVCR
jgi:hypothetical protein